MQQELVIQTEKLARGPPRETTTLLNHRGWGQRAPVGFHATKLCTTKT